jgi:hypothetical protein
MKSENHTILDHISLQHPTKASVSEPGADCSQVLEVNGLQDMDGEEVGREVVCEPKIDPHAVRGLARARLLHVLLKSQGHRCELADASVGRCLGVGLPDRFSQLLRTTSSWLPESFRHARYLGIGLLWNLRRPF